MLETELDDTLTAVVIDFQKLLLSNSDEKVMVFKCHSEEFPKWVDFLKMSITKYRKANGIFHFIARMNNTSEFKRITIDLNSAH